MFHRDICSWKLLNVPPKQIGGVSHKVRIDESALTKRKYNRGKVIKRNKEKKTTWILGMLDTTTMESVILYVEKRDKCTLLSEIQRHVKPLTTIWTDCWKAYDYLDNSGYVHETVNHSKQFKSITGVCTNAIEGHWRNLKMFIRSLNAMSSKFLFEYIDQFMWCNEFGRTPHSKFHNMLAHIKEKYVL